MQRTRTESDCVRIVGDPSYFDIVQPGVWKWVLALLRQSTDFNRGGGAPRAVPKPHAFDTVARSLCPTPDYSTLQACPERNVTHRRRKTYHKRNPDEAKNASRNTVGF